jgi:crotonobetainyl-CoA:carnitine CoA-transferase CaiB-like acyl-CoA transferase
VAGPRKTRDGQRTNEEREDDRDREAALLTDILQTRTADEWETFFQAHHVPAARVRTLADAVRDPQLATRGVTHRHRSAAGVDGAFDVPLAAFKFAHGGPSIETPPPELGADTDSVLAEHGYDADQIAAFCRARVI